MPRTSSIGLRALPSSIWSETGVVQLVK